ncbi:hypothetical protein LCGC14_1233710 [marine sediment metagenome]|uniref:Uncharacterized protein n=1 Tax=marine sediment metagenome TaxID=412755 RepID=A0A0F9LBX6_9ZZZZ
MGDEGCKGKVSGGWNSYSCSRKATRDGYCFQHHPDAIKKRRQESQRKYDAVNEAERQKREKKRDLQIENERLRDRVLELGGGQCGLACRWGDGDCREQQEARCNALEWSGE